MNEELNEKMKELEKEYASKLKELTNIFLEKIEKIKEEFKKKEKTFLKTGDIYYFINHFNNVHSKYYGNNKSDRKLLRIGNFFKTKEEAEFELERRKVITELNRFSCEFKVDNRNYYLFYECVNGLLYFTYDNYHKRSDIYFESEEKVNEAIEHVGKERILKYYLGIKEK